MQDAVTSEPVQIPASASVPNTAETLKSSVDSDSKAKDIPK
jgi:hypothetical protein